MTTAEAGTKRAEADSDHAATSVTLTPGLQSAYSPQFAPGGPGAKGRLLFLSQDAACETGTHDGTVALHSLPWPGEVRSWQACRPPDAVGIEKRSSPLHPLATRTWSLRSL